MRALAHARSCSRRSRAKLPNPFLVRPHELEIQRLQRLLGPAHEDGLFSNPCTFGVQRLTVTTQASQVLDTRFSERDWFGGGGGGAAIEKET